VGFAARWGRKIKPDVSKYVALFCTNLLPSGQTLDVWKELMRNLFCEKTWATFPLHELCEALGKPPQVSLQVSARKQPRFFRRQPIDPVSLF